MINRGPRETPIRAGDADGLGQVYSEFGGLILGPTETVLAERKGWDLAAYRSWRIFFPKPIFHPLAGSPSGTLHLTSERLIYLRNIDVWKEVKPLLTPLGIPAAAEKESRLERLKAQGARQYCEVNFPQFHLAGIKRRSWFMRFRLLASDGRRYELFLRTDQEDADFFDLLESTVRKHTVHL